jgi:hypothetical protein
LHRPTSRIVGSGKPSYIPVRSPSQVQKVEIKRNGHAQPFAKGHKRTTTEFTEANGAIPPKIHFQPDPELELELTSEPEQGCYPPAFTMTAFSDGSSFQGVMKVCRTPPHLLYGPLRSPRQRSSNRFLLLVIRWFMRRPSRIPLLLTTKPRRPLLPQPQLPSTWHSPSSPPPHLVRPSALPKSNLKLLPHQTVSPTSLAHLHRPKTRRKALTSCLRIVKAPVRSTLPSQRHLVHPAGGPQHLRPHVRKLPSPLQLRSHRLS